jgi:hypothetical protein
MVSTFSDLSRAVMLPQSRRGRLEEMASRPGMARFPWRIQHGRFAIHMAAQAALESVHHRPTEIDVNAREQ